MVARALLRWFFLPQQRSRRTPMTRAIPIGTPASTPTLLDFLEEGSVRGAEEFLIRVKVGPERIVRLFPSETRNIAISVLLVLLSHSAFISIKA